MSQPSIGITGQMRVVLKSANKRIFRSLLSLASAALLVRIMGMCNQIIVSSRFGAGATMDAYFVASAFPLLLSQLIAGAIESSVIPVYSRLRSRGTKEQATRLFSTILNLLIISSLLLTITIIFFRHQIILFTAPAFGADHIATAGYLALFIYPALFLIVIIGFLECILNAEGQFGWPAYAGLLVPVITAILVLLFGKNQGTTILCIGTLVGLSLQLCAFIIRAKKAKLAYRPVICLTMPEMRTILLNCWPVMCGALISQASPLVDQIFASFLSSGSISAISYSLKLMSVPMGVIFISAGRAALPYLSRQVAINDMKAFKETLRLYLWGVGSGTIALSIVMITGSHFIIQILFQHGAFTVDDTNRTAITLSGFAIGLIPMAIGVIVARAFDALGKTKVLMGVSVFSVFANAIFDFIFSRFWQGFGIALATSAVYTCTMMIMILTLRHMIGDLKLFTPPQEVRTLIRKVKLLPYSVHQTVIHACVALMVCTIGIAGTIINATYTLRISLVSFVIVAFLRYRYALLITWVLLDVFVGSAITFFSGKNIDTALTVPTILLMLCLPVKQTFKRVPALAFMLFYLLWVLAGIRISPLQPAQFMISWLLLMDCVAISVLLIHVLVTRRRMMGLIDCILGVAVFTAFYAFYSCLFHRNGVFDPQTSLFRTFSIFGSSPSFSFFLSITIPLAFYRTLTLSASRRIYGIATTITLFIALGLTFTRSSLISVPLSIILICFFIPSRKLQLSLFTGIGTSIVLATLLTLLGYLPFLDRFLNKDIATLNGRTYLWQAIITHFNPYQVLGQGLGASNDLLVRLHVGINGKGLIATAPHNLFLGTLYDHGIVGVTLLILVLFILFINLLRGIQKSAGQQRLLFVTALAVFCSMVLQSLESNDIWIQGIGLYFWIVMALPFAVGNSTPEPTPHKEDTDITRQVTVPDLATIAAPTVQQLSHV